MDDLYAQLGLALTDVLTTLSSRPEDTVCVSAYRNRVTNTWEIVHFPYATGRNVIECRADEDDEWHFRYIRAQSHTKLVLSTNPDLIISDPGEPYNTQDLAAKVEAFRITHGDDTRSNMWTYLMWASPSLAGREVKEHVHAQR